MYTIQREDSVKADQFDNDPSEHCPVLGLWLVEDEDGGHALWAVCGPMALDEVGSLWLLETSMEAFEGLDDGDYCFTNASESVPALLVRVHTERLVEVAQIGWRDRTTFAQESAWDCASYNDYMGY